MKEKKKWFFKNLKINYNKVFYFSVNCKYWFFLELECYFFFLFFNFHRLFNNWLFWFFFALILWMLRFVLLFIRIASVFLFLFFFLFFLFIFIINVFNFFNCNVIWIINSNKIWTKSNIFSTIWQKTILRINLIPFLKRKRLFSTFDLNFIWTN